jgi:hypothetical protein
MSTYAWTVYATQTAIVLAVTGLLGPAVFQILGRIDRLGERVDALGYRLDERIDGIGERIDGMGGRLDALSARMNARFKEVDARFERLEDRMRQDKDEFVGRLDGVAERLTRLETRGGSAA